MNNIGREEILPVLMQELEKTDFVRAALEGGAAANNRLDKYSDLDLGIAVSDNKIDETFNIIEETLEKLSPITHRWIVPEPTWHGNSQRFYILKDGMEFFFVDLVVMKAEKEGDSDEVDLMEIERHGQPVIYFDKDNLINAGPLDRKKFYDTVSAHLKNLEASFPFFQELVLKEIRRGHKLDAWWFYSTALLKSASTCLGVRYRPFHYDFNLRYCYSEMPPEAARQLEELCFVSSMDDIQAGVETITRIVDETMVWVEQGGLSRAVGR